MGVRRMIAKLTIEQVNKLWPKLSPLLESANDYSLHEYNIDDILELITTQKTECWLMWEGDEILATLTTQIVDYPRQKGLHIFLAASIAPIGEIVEEFITTVEQWGKEQGCTVCKIDGRRGWLKLLPDYEVQRTLLAKNL